MPPTDPQPRSILLVDDEPMIVETVKMLLQLDGHRVETAGDAGEALAKFAPGRFDLVMSDYMMPGMKGDELAAAIRALAPTQPIVFVSAHATMMKSELTMPNVEIVSKPFTLATLREAIARVLKTDQSSVS